MSEITTRPCAAGPGFALDDIRRKYLALASNDIQTAFYMACHDVQELIRGGEYRIPPMDGPAPLKLDTRAVDEGRV